MDSCTTPSPLAIPFFHWLLCPLFSPLPFLREGHFYFSPIGFSFCPSSSTTLLLSIYWLAFRSSLVPPPLYWLLQTHPVPTYHLLLTLIGLLTRPSPFLYPPWQCRPSVTHQTTSDWRRRWAHPEGRSLAVRSLPEARSRRLRRRRAARSRVGSRPGARRSPGARTRRGPARSPPRHRRPRALVASRGRREVRA